MDTTEVMLEDSVVVHIMEDMLDMALACMDQVFMDLSITLVYMVQDLIMVHMLYHTLELSHLNSRYKKFQKQSENTFIFVLNVIIELFLNLGILKIVIFK